MDAIDWGTVNWTYVGLLVAIVFVTSLIGALLSFRRSILSALISTVLFAAAFMGWTYYPHHLPLPKSPIRAVAAPPPAAPAPAAAAPASPTGAPSNPVRDIAPR
jgi:hypothetical protein